MSKFSGIVFLIINLYGTDHVYIYNFWYNFISINKDKTSSSYQNVVLELFFLKPKKTFYDNEECTYFDDCLTS